MVKETRKKKNHRKERRTRRGKKGGGKGLLKKKIPKGVTPKDRQGDNGWGCRVTAKEGTLSRWGGVPHPKRVTVKRESRGGGFMRRNRKSPLVGETR